MQKMYFIFGLLCLSVSVWSQDLDNGGLESWNYNSAANYYEPTGYWATANQLSLLSASAPITTFRESTLVYSGEYAAKMVTGSFLTLPVPGTIVVGTFEINIADPSQSFNMGMPFTERPDYFSGYYMYFPEGGDSSVIYAELRKNGALIAEAPLVIYDTVDQYTYFSIPFSYSSQEAPDSMTVVAVSSAGGQEFNAVEGSTLYVDELSFSYAVNINVPLMPEITMQVYPNPSSNYLYVQGAINADAKASLQLYNLQGQSCLNEPLMHAHTQVDISCLASGMYWYQIQSKRGTLAGGKLRIK
jgi:hypothetical protein